MQCQANPILERFDSEFNSIQFNLFILSVIKYIKMVRKKKYYIQYKIAAQLKMWKHIM